MRRNKIADQVAQLRKQGYKVKIEHSRLTALGLVPVRKLREMNEALTAEGKQRIAVMPNGGLVRAEITTPDRGTIVAESECSLLDNFNTTTGTSIALGRALLFLDEAEHQRRLLRRREAKQEAERLLLGKV